MLFIPFAKSAIYICGNFNSYKSPAAAAHADKLSVGEDGVSGAGRNRTAVGFGACIAGRGRPWWSQSALLPRSEPPPVTRSGRRHAPLA